MFLFRRFGILFVAFLVLNEVLSVICYFLNKIKLKLK